MYQLRFLEYVWKGTSFGMVGLLLFQVAATFIASAIFLIPFRVSAAEVVIDTTISTTATSHLVGGTQTVFIDDQIGYSFYRDRDGTCVYKKTTDAGSTWNAAVVVDGQADCIKIVVWFDQWTPGKISDPYIHISTMDTNSNSLFYNRLDTTTDTLLLGSSPVNITTFSGQTPTFATTQNSHTITIATDDVIYVATSDASDSFVVSCSSGCTNTSDWTEVGTNPLDLTTDYNLLVPLSGGNVMVINRDISADDLRSKIWNGSGWSGWSAIDSNAPEHGTYDVGMSVTLDILTGDIYLAYIADNNNFTVADHDIRTAVYSSSAWSTMADVLTNEPGRGLLAVTIGYDQNTDDVYVAYSIRDVIATTASANVYWKQSTDGMTSWGSEQGPLNSSSGDIYNVYLNTHSYERLYVTWYDHTALILYGDTVANISPDTELSATGTQATEVLAGSTGHYLGGSFVLSSIGSRTVTEIQIAETGTIHAQNDIKNVALYYDLDMSAPYDCSGESYSGLESQFGVTSIGGFSGADGIINFTGSIVSLSPTQTMCMYIVFDVQSTATDGDTIKIQVTNSNTDVKVSSGLVHPITPIAISGNTTVVSPNLTQTHYHWRNDDGDESSATSATGGAEDVSLTAVQKEITQRLRLQVSNEGSTSTAAVLQLQYGIAAPTCEDIGTWNNVGIGDDAWNMSPTANLTDGANTTNIAVSSGGVTDENSVFLSSNGGIRDATSTLSTLILDTTDYIEMEFAIAASSTATEGATYCFRLADSSSSLTTYDVYPAATIDADIRVSATSTQVAMIDIPSTNAYFGGVFAIRSNAGPQTVTSVTITETGTVDASAGLENIALFYEFDISSPYNCSSESFSGSETPFGSTVANFSAPNGTSTFTDSIGIDNTSTLCLYVVADVTEAALSGQTVSFEIVSPITDVLAGAASVAPGSPITFVSSTVLQGAELVQNHYHWRDDDGNESAATSVTGGVENTPVQDFTPNTPIRLRLSVSNEGATTSVPNRFQLEFAPKITTCDLAAVWTNVDAVGADDWNMFDSSFLTNGEDTTNIAVGTGGVSDENISFLSPNGGVRDTESRTGSTTLQTTEFVELEYSIESTNDTAYNTTYCFRVTNNGVPLFSYTSYPEITTTKKRDFKVQRGNAIVTGTSTVLIAGVDYVAPQNATAAFIRITNSHHTGAGDIVGGGAQNADDITAYIYQPETIMSHATIGRLSNVAETYVDWEIVEFVGAPATDNEMVVRDVGTVTLINSALVATGTTIAVTDATDVVVYITGIRNRNTSRNYYAGQVSSAWNANTNQPVFTRAATGNSIVDVSYAIVEYAGDNWRVQRVEHSYAAAGVTETESITAVNSLERTFLHAQKRVGATANVVDFGHTVWLSSIGLVSFELETGASVAVEQTSVAWVIENTQTGPNGMKIQRLNGNTINGAEPFTQSETLATLDAVNNTSVFINSRAAGANTSFPRPIVGARIASTTGVDLWRSDTGSQLTYRAEIVEWPVADLALRQNYYRLYVDNDTLTPVDSWPPGLDNLGENTSLTEADEPLGVGEYVRLRMAIRVSNANLPAGFQSLKLQYAERVTTCTAATGWEDVGVSGSAEPWRGFTGLNTTDGTSLSLDPPLPGDLLLSVSDVAGVLVHDNPSTVNPYKVYDGEDVEYDWYLEQNGATPETMYCFRVARVDGSLLEGYFHYPQIQTAGFEPQTQDWRWYSDIENETPSTAVAAENTAPTNININDTLALRVTVGEVANVVGIDVKFKLQFSDDSSFVNAQDVVASSTCLANSLWCYADGGGTDNTLITTSLLSDGDGCVAATGNGCGTHNATAEYVPGHTHGATRAQEYSFTLMQSGARTNAVYYFRLVSIATEKIVPLDIAATYPSVQTGDSALTFTISGLPSGTTTASVVTNASTTPVSIDFGSVPLHTDVIAAQRISVVTNATEGYQVQKYAAQPMSSSVGAEIPAVTGTNAAPGAWLTVCSSAETGCVGYHSTDAILLGGSTRFGASDTYAGFHATPEEVMYSSVPTEDSADIVYRLRVTELQPAGDYLTNIVYLAIPVH